MNHPKPEPRLSRLVVTCAAIALAAAVGGLAGCKKPKPAPPPPPPPPPPEPVVQDINLDTLLQELKADARVQFAPAVTLTDDRLGLARGIVRLADSIARGAASDLKPLITRNAQNVLEELEATGSWQDATKRIEGVRVVSVQSGAHIPGHAGATGVVLAIQEPEGTGAYLLAWAAQQAGETWVFANAPTTMEVRPRASAWDGVGSEAFQAMKLGAVEPPKPAKAEGEQEETPKEEEPPPPAPSGGKGGRRRMGS